MSTIISVENLSKSYRLGQIGTGTFSRDLEVWWARLLGKPNPLLRIGERDHGNRDGEELWALKDVSFKVEQGEVLGIIGRNGAGKSTLLKILSRVTAPTSGKVKVKGRIASLLEVGTGFHPELTGRENIYLNGAILGMTREEVWQKFDEIVAFSEIEKFIDTPVKRYSSGMYVRLAFAVAAHLEPEILVVDEVLAVGDAEFQKKCLGKMGSVANAGRTVLFVSHNMAAVKELCSTAIVLNRGSVALPKSLSFDAIDYYHRFVINNLIESGLEQRQDRNGTGKLKFTKIEFYDSDDQNLNSLSCGHSVKIRLYYKLNSISENVSVSISFGSHSGENKILLWTDLLNANYHRVDRDGYFECFIPRLPLFPGNYLISVFCQSGSEILDWIREVQFIEVLEGDYYQQGKFVAKGKMQGVLVEHFWRQGETG